MISSKTIRAALTGAAFLVGGMAATPAMAQDASYEGETVTILLGHPPGGSYDLYAQLAAAHFGRFLPGNPTVIVQHMPGGGGSLAAAHFANRSERDGTVVGLFPETLAHTQLLDPQRARWDVREMRYVGSFAPVNPAFVINANAPAQTVEELFETEMNVACTGRTSQSYQMPAMLASLADMKFNLTCGYEGSGAATLALERGEVDMLSSAWNSWRSSHMEQFEAGTLKVIMQGGLTRMSELSDVPLMQEVVEDEAVKAALEFASAGAPIGRSLVAPPETPDDRLQALRDAFDAMVTDEEFLADAERRAAFIEPASGAEIQTISDGIIETPADVVEMARQAQE